MGASAAGPQPWKPRRISSDGSDKPEIVSSRLPDLGRIRRTPWSRIPDNAIVLAGAIVNGAPPPELVGFPPMNRVLREGLISRYRFLPDHSVLIAEPVSPVQAGKLSNDVRTLHKQITSLRELLGDIEEERRKVLGLLDGTDGTEAGRNDDEQRVGFDDGEPAGSDSTPLWKLSGVTEPSRLLKDRYASFAVTLNPHSVIPSFLYGSVPRRVTIAELLLHEMKQERFIPRDIPVVLHLVLDVSFSMKSRGKLEYALGACNQLAATLPGIVSNTTVVPYLFSEETRQIDAPIERISIQMKGTKMATVFRAVLANRVEGVRNKVILITDGEPEDETQALAGADLLRRNRIDYTQIVLHHHDDLRYPVRDEYLHLAATDGLIDDERRAELEASGIEIAEPRSEPELQQALDRRFDRFTALAETAGGNQIVLTLFPALALVNLEVYDRYLGLLTLVS